MERLTGFKHENLMSIASSSTYASVPVQDVPRKMMSTLISTSSRRSWSGGRWSETKLKSSYVNLGWFWYEERALPFLRLSSKSTNAK
jgi:hypothetical protein